MRLPVLTVLAASLFVGAAHAATFYSVVQNSGIAGLSHNGRIATGVIANGMNGAPAWRWTPERGLEMIPDFLDANGSSAWAQPIAGAVLDENGNEVAAIAYSNASVAGSGTAV